MSELLMLEQRPGRSDAAPWILDRHGQRQQGHDDSRRSAELRAGLIEHERVHSCPVEVEGEELERIVEQLHEPDYLEALRTVEFEQPTLLPQWAPPGLPADSPVWMDVVETAFEGMRTAIAAAQRVLGGARYTYALSRPPGHHAGPSWMGGYCYLNTAGAAAQVLGDGGAGPVGILDLDFHFPTGTCAVAAQMQDVQMHSLHASTLQNVPWRAIEPRPNERFFDFATPPDEGTYIEALEFSVKELGRSTNAIVLSLGYDTIGGDPHGSWSLEPEVFAQVGRVLAASELPVCVVQEGGYALKTLSRCSNAFARGLLNGASQ